MTTEELNHVLKKAAAKSKRTIVVTGRIVGVMLCLAVFAYVAPHRR